MKLSSSTIRDIAYNLALDLGLRRITAARPPKPSYKGPAGGSPGTGLTSHPYWNYLSEDAKNYLLISNKPTKTEDEIKKLQGLQQKIRKTHPGAKFLNYDQGIEDLLEAEGLVHVDRPRSFERMPRPSAELIEETDEKAKRKAFLADKGFLEFLHYEAKCQACDRIINSAKNPGEYPAWKKQADEGLPCPSCAHSALTGTRTESKAEFIRGETAVNPKAQLRAIVHDAPRQISLIGDKVIIHPQYSYVMAPPLERVGTVIGLDGSTLPDQNYWKAIKSILIKFKNTVYGSEDAGSISKLDLIIAYDYTASKYLKNASLEKFLLDVRQNELLSDSELSYSEEVTSVPVTPFDVDQYIKERKDNGVYLIGPTELASLLNKFGMDSFLEQQANLNPVTKRYPRPLSDAAKKEILTKYFESNGLTVAASVGQVLPQIEEAWKMLHDSGLFPGLTSQQFNNYIAKVEKARDISEMLTDYLYDNRSVLARTFELPEEKFRKDSIAKIIENLSHSENPVGRESNLKSVFENFLTDPVYARERIDTGIDDAGFNLEEVETILKKRRIPTGVVLTFIEDAGMTGSSSKEIADKYEKDRVQIAKEKYLGNVLKSKNLNVLNSIYDGLKSLGSGPNVMGNLKDLSYSDLRQVFEFIETTYQNKDEDGNEEILDVFTENGVM